MTNNYHLIASWFKRGVGEHSRLGPALPTSFSSLDSHQLVKSHAYSHFAHWHGKQNGAWDSRPLI